MSNTEVELWIKLKGNEYAMGATNVDRTKPGWLIFDRVNTKTGEITGHMEVNESEVVSVEAKQQD